MIVIRVKCRIRADRRNEAMVRTVIFWTHLVCGVATGLVVLMMSVTGVILTYERQMLAWPSRDFYANPPGAVARQPIDALLAAAARTEPEFAFFRSVHCLSPVGGHSLRKGCRFAFCRPGNPFTDPPNDARGSCPLSPRPKAR
jgi:hypothetical protein